MSASAISTVKPTDLAPHLARAGVVIVTYRSRACIGSALASLTGVGLAGVVVVDNASDDGTADAVRGTGGLTLVENPTNLGFGAACNIGAREVGERGAFVLFLNPDAVIDATNMGRLVGYLLAHPRCAVVAPRLFRDGVALTSGGARGSLRSELRLVAPARVVRWLRDRRFAPGYDRTGPVGYVEGACFMVRREALVAVGGFDEGYFLFYEELDLARRVARHGWTVDLCAMASASHEGGRSRQTIPANGKPHLVRSARRYLRQHHGLGAAVAFSLVHRTTRRRRGLQ